MHRDAAYAQPTSRQINPSALDVIKAGIAYTPNAVVRAEAVEALEAMGSAEVLPWIRSALLDEHAGVRFAACMVLGRLKDHGSVSALQKCLTDKDDNVRVAAIFALHQLGHRQQTGKLPNYVLLHPDPIVRRNAAIAISLLGEKSAIMVLARAMKDADPGVRHHALEGMVRLGNKEAARELSFMVNSGVGSEEVFALNALAATGDPAYEDTFRYKLGSGAHVETRLAAARGLGKLGIEAGLPIVLEALKPNHPVRPDPDDPPADQMLRIRQMAAGAAGAIGSDKAVPLLEPLLREGTDPRIQIAAARALLEISFRGTHRPWQSRNSAGTQFKP